MKALVYHGKEDLRLDEAAEPVCREGHAIVEVRSAGICGSDLTVYLGKHPGPGRRSSWATSSPGSSSTAKGRAGPISAWETG